MTSSVNTLTDIIQNWPVIVQGALGAALFAAVLYVGERLYTVLAFGVSRISRPRRLTYLNNRRIRLYAVKSEDLLSRTYFVSVLWYRASREVVKALMWLTLGLLFTNFVGVWGVIGYLGCLFYLLFALSVVKPIIESGDQLDAEIEKVRAALAELAPPDDD